MSGFNIKNRKFEAFSKKTRRPLEFVLLSLLLFTLAGLIASGRLQPKTTSTNEVKPYTYDIKQAVDVRTKYRNNSFFGVNPDASNTAYLTDLTDSLEAQFKYAFKANKAADLSYQYNANAVIRALYGSDRSSEASQSIVWSKQFTLLQPVRMSQNGSSISLEPTIQIPFSDYLQQMEQFRNAYSAAVNTELLVTYTVQLDGTVDGVPFSETKISRISVPLDQQIYKVSIQFDKSDQKRIDPAASDGLGDAFKKLKLPLAAVLVLAGIVSAAYGLRKQLILSPYQRKLAKIYRYHDGIIVRAKQPPDLRKKNIVTITSFDDMLNLEEELKTPIIASQLSDYTTHFFIAQDDIIYVFTLGIPIPFKDSLSIHDEK